MSNIKVLITIIVMAVITFSVRALPFYCIELFKDSPLVRHLAYTLPAAIMLILVIFTLKDTTYLSYPYGIPILTASGITVLIHLWKRNALFSIGLGLITYELLRIVLT